MKSPEEQSREAWEKKLSSFEMERWNDRPKRMGGYANGTPPLHRDYVISPAQAEELKSMQTKMLEAASARANGGCFYVRAEEVKPYMLKDGQSTQCPQCKIVWWADTDLPCPVCPEGKAKITTDDGVKHPSIGHAIAHLKTEVKANDEEITRLTKAIADMDELLLKHPAPDPAETERIANDARELNKVFNPGRLEIGGKMQEPGPTPELIEGYEERIKELEKALEKAELGKTILLARLGMAANAQWQDISTAPKDGTWVLIAWDSPGRYDNPDALRRVAYWSERYQVWTPSEGFSMYKAPTHWMPLPEPPKES